MSIKSFQAEALVLIASTDTTILNPTVGRAGITQFSLHEQTGVGETVELFVSSDATSAAGERVDTITFSADETINPISVNGRTIRENEFLIGKATTGNLVVASVTYTQFSGSS